MGDPPEIPNAIRTAREPPRRRGWQRWADPVTVAWRALFGRRKTTRADAPAAFGRGVDPRRMPIRAEERQQLDVDALAERLVDPPPPE